MKITELYIYLLLAVVLFTTAAFAATGENGDFEVNVIHSLMIGIILPILCEIIFGVQQKVLSHKIFSFRGERLVKKIIWEKMCYLKNVCPKINQTKVTKVDKPLPKRKV